MLCIVNVSPPGTSRWGKNQYEIRINQRVIGEFEHERTPDGAAQCLRDAADALEKFPKMEQDRMLEALLEIMRKYED